MQDYRIRRGPRRVQLQRVKGWKMPANTVKVDRRTPWGNPTKIGPGETAHFAVACFKDYVRENPAFAARARAELKGKNLACWCKLGELCHADVLLKLANS